MMNVLYQAQKYMQESVRRHIPVLLTTGVLIPLFLEFDSDKSFIPVVK
jgi:hypothetical protein